MIPAMFVARAEILSLVALAAAERQSIPELLNQAATTLGPLARRSARRLAHRLESGMPIGQALWRQGYISPFEARRVDGGVDARRRLQRLAEDAARADTGLLLVRWFPVWVMVALLVPGWILFNLIEWLSDRAIYETYKVLGIAANSLLDTALAAWWLQVLTLGGCIAAVALGMVILREIAVIRHLTHLWCPEVHRAYFALRLIRALGPGEDQSYELPWYRAALAALFIGIHRPQKPRWAADWAAWFFLTRFRLPAGEQRMLGPLHSLSLRLSAMGLLGSERNAPLMAEEQARERLSFAIREARPLLIAVLAVLSLISLTMTAASTLVHVTSHIVGGF